MYRHPLKERHRYIGIGETCSYKFMWYTLETGTTKIHRGYSSASFALCDYTRRQSTNTVDKCHAACGGGWVPKRVKIGIIVKIILILVLMKKSLFLLLLSHFPSTLTQSDLYTSLRLEVSNICFRLWVSVFEFHWTLLPVHMSCAYATDSELLRVCFYFSLK